MTITFHVPQDMEKRLREVSPDLEREAQEALALDLFRREKITHYELGKLLDMNRVETDAFLVDRNEFAQSPTLNDLESDYQNLTRLMAAQPR